MSQPEGSTVERRRDTWIAFGFALLMLLPFIAKPFHLDDPLFVWSGQQIVRARLDFFGFDVNWENATRPMWSVTQNPPLMSYLLALPGAVSGWNEVTLHFLLIFPAAMVILGTMRLLPAADRTKRVLAAALVATAPVFVVSATNVMCDVTMLAFYVWSVVQWRDGLEERSTRRLILAALLASLGYLTKFFAITLVPLLLLYTVARRRRDATECLWLLLPVGVAVAYDLLTFSLYGHAHFLGAGTFAKTMRGTLHAGLSEPALVLLAVIFTGGSVATMGVVHALATTRRDALSQGGGALLLVVLVALFGGLAARPIAAPPLTSPAFATSMALAAMGAAALLVVLGRAARSLEATQLMLATWIAGTIAFAALFNWTINGRTLLPLVVPIAVLTAGVVHSQRGAWISIALSAVIAWSVAAADFVHARAERDAAEQIMTRLQSVAPTVWFRGHWGFQYYMQIHGARPVDDEKARLQRGDAFIIPHRSTGVAAPPPNARRIATLTLRTLSFIGTMDPSVGAGFYGDFYGPLPWAFGETEPLRFEVTKLE